MLEQEGIAHEVRLYMKDEESMNVVELEGVLEALDLDASDLVRVNEALWKEAYKDLELDEDEIILAMVENPRLMQRPIVINGDKGVIARPAEEIKRLL
tara:strand:+ start:10302 stop:10595 length:294 start_codon:yes stop_codon:yes gene_type:complete